tara:strand:- start:610 stop:876 length:267 start_codon:yes stop_codon:yes gene_type:complete
MGSRPLRKGWYNHRSLKLLVECEYKPKQTPASIEPSEHYTHPCNGNIWLKPESDISMCKFIAEADACSEDKKLREESHPKPAPQLPVR